jgi:hypothetical protein
VARVQSMGVGMAGKIALSSRSVLESRRRGRRARRGDFVDTPTSCRDALGRLGRP